VLAALCLCLLPQDEPAVRVLAPRELQVVQRDERGAADVRVRVAAPPAIGRLVARVPGTDARAELARSVDVLEATLRVPEGGWRALEIEADGVAGPVVLARVERFGVGEVFVVAGQSNSSNYGEERWGTLDERVVAFDGRAWRVAQDPMPGVQDGSQGGSPWPVCGCELVRRLRVPVAFASVGYGGTSIAQWQRGAQLDGGELSLYAGLLARVRALARFRAILWHQGESDAHGGTTSEQYVQRFRALQDALREDARFAGPWVVAHASYVPGGPRARLDAIRAAQSELWETERALRGPDTDDLLGELRHSQDGIHFSKAGLEAHGRRWAERLAAHFGGERR
jgi:hypothetical protein